MPSLLTQRVAKSVALVPGMLRPAPPGLTVLLYHRIGEGTRGIDLPAPVFARQLEMLAARATVVGLTDGLARAADGEDGLVALTFDDGSADFHTHALPILARFAMPATVYVSTGPVDEGLPFPSWRGGDEPIPALSWTQIGECVASGLVTIGSHTHTHADLDRIDDIALADELDRSKALIEDRTGRACDDFAYPHAVFGPRAEDAVRARYRTAAIGGWRRNPSTRIDPYRIARIPITRADGPLFFRAKVGGRLSAEALLYRIGGTKRG